MSVFDIMNLNNFTKKKVRLSKFRLIIKLNLKSPFLGGSFWQKWWFSVLKLILRKIAFFQMP